MNAKITRSERTFALRAGFVGALTVREG